MDTALFVLLLSAEVLLVCCAFYFWFESAREDEKRASAVGATFFLIGGSLLLSNLFIAVLRIPFAGLFAAIGVFGILLIIPARKDPQLSKGSERYIVAEAVRHDERDIVFARFRSLPVESEVYRRYYEMHPERKERDAVRRSKGFFGKQIPGIINAGYASNVAMINMAHTIPDFLGPYALAKPISSGNREELGSEKAADIVKHLTLHLGADMVGICRVNENWIYSHRGEIHYENWEDWGKPIHSLPSYAVVFLTEMGKQHVASAPHTPTVAESMHLYARGAYISTLLAQWFAQMGYVGIAQNTRHYDLVLPPVAVDAGLGEIGRHGYLIAPRFGARVRIFAVLTDMVLSVDKAINLGVDAFCKRCKKCAASCPSQSIPHGQKVVYGGAEKWKIDEESCFDYWSKVGTDCCICMAVCPFSRPDTALHQVIRRIVSRSFLAQTVFPYLDNWIYGRKWRSKSPPSWLKHS